MIADEVKELEKEIAILSQRLDEVNNLITVGMKTVNFFKAEFREIADKLNEKAIRLNSISSSEENLEEAINSLDKNRV